MSWNFDEKINREGTGSLKYDLRKEIFGTDEVIPMWVADMDFKTPEFIIKAMRKRLNHEIMGYTIRPPEYAHTITRWLLARHNWRAEDEWVCFSPGIVPALNLCTLAFTRPGDSVIVQPPVYFPFFSAVESHGRNLAYNQLREENGNWSIDFESLAGCVNEKTKMIIICNPHNPVGRAWRRDELMRLAEICLENEIIIISDEIHCDLVLPGYKHVPVASLSDEISSITVTCLAPSKTFNLAGLSTSSVVISNPVLRKYFKNKIEHLHIGNGNIFGTVASISAYSGGESWLAELLVYIKRNIEFIEDFCREYIPEIRPVHPEATYMIWLDCRRLGMTGKELGNFFVRQAGVGMNEGSVFGPGGGGFMRMNIATQFDTVKRGMEQIEKAVASLR